MEPLEVVVRKTAVDVDVITTAYPLPGYGFVPINAYLLHAREAVLVDTGPGVLSGAYLDALRSRIALEEIRWIWLTHADPDHVGCLREVLALAPHATLVTTFLGLGKLGLSGAIPPTRVHLLNPGQELDVGDRRLLALKPPTFDAPETTALYDEKTDTLFSSDCFGAILTAVPELASAIDPAVLADGVVIWATVDAPWLSLITGQVFDNELSRLRALAPRWVLSSHLPPAEGMLDGLLDHLAHARSAPPFVGPDQSALERMLAAAE
jgi:glyoxylase-like metal-dependent hydrolase (beta-lactamase superfamily II)